MDRRTSVAMGGEDLKESENVATSNFLSIVEDDEENEVGTTNVSKEQSLQVSRISKNKAVEKVEKEITRDTN